MAKSRGRSGKKEATLLAEAMALGALINESKRGGGKKRKGRNVEGLIAPHESAAKKYGKGKPCQVCHKYHSKSSHASHGLGSFERTHGGKEFRLARELHSQGAEDLLALL